MTEQDDINRGPTDDDARVSDALAADAARLATAIAPERDLWPDIERAIQAPAKPRSPWLPYFAQAAAVLLLVGGSSAVTYQLTKPGRDTITEPPPGLAPQVDVEFASFGGEYALSQGFVDARANLVAELDVDLDRLSPETRADVEDNLAIIRSAIREINTALQREPDNVHLQELLLKTYHEELAVMRAVGGLTKDVMSRNDI